MLLHLLDIVLTRNALVEVRYTGSLENSSMRAARLS